MTEAMRIAEHYFKLSNDGALAQIQTLFGPSSTYSSAHTGVYLGADEIIAMQTRFFAGFKRLQWEVHSMEEVKPGIVLFDFTLRGETHEGEQLVRAGDEYVVVHDGRIQHVEVRNKA